MTRAGPVTPEQVDRLQSILAGGAVVKILAGASDQGSGVLVAPGLVLTNRHVVRRAVDGKVRLRRRVGEQVEEVDGTVQPETWPASLDLAIVACDLAEPCVVLDDEPVLARDPLRVAGFPGTRPGEVGGDDRYECPGYESDGSHQRLDGQSYLRFSQNAVLPGMSGGAVVSEHTGFVVGITRLAAEVEGGFAIPVATIAALVPDVAALVRRPPAAAEQWLSALGATHLQKSGRSTDGSRPDSTLRRIELTVDRRAGQPQDVLGSWEVSLVVDPGGRDPVSVAPVPVGAAELGDDALEAVERWSRRLGPADDAALLGRVLHGALLPPAVAGELERAVESGGGRPLVRLRVDPDSRVGVIPWELACPKGRSPISTRSDLAFSRSAGGPNLPTSPRPSLQVLAVLAGPAGGAGDPGIALAVREALGEPSARSLVPAPGNPRLSVWWLLNPGADDLIDTLEGPAPAGGSWDVVHYVGTGHGRRDAAVLSAADDGSTVRVSRLRESLAARPPALVVAELLDGDPAGSLGLDDLSALLVDGTAALVATQLGVSVALARTFNRTFYRELGKGAAVEWAVQQGRRSVSNEGELGQLAHGSLVVVSRSPGGHQLLTPTTTDDAPSANLQRSAP